MFVIRLYFPGLRFRELENADLASADLANKDLENTDVSQTQKQPLLASVINFNLSPLVLLSSSFLFLFELCVFDVCGLRFRGLLFRDTLCRCKPVGITRAKGSRLYFAIGYVYLFKTRTAKHKKTSPVSAVVFHDEFLRCSM